MAGLLSIIRLLESNSRGTAGQPDPVRQDRVMQVLLRMTGWDLDALARAYDGTLAA